MTTEVIIQNPYACHFLEHHLRHLFGTEQIIGVTSGGSATSSYYSIEIPNAFSRQNLIDNGIITGSLDRLAPLIGNHKLVIPRSSFSEDMEEKLAMFEGFDRVTAHDEKGVLHFVVQVPEWFSRDTLSFVGIKPLTKDLILSRPAAGNNKDLAIPAYLVPVQIQQYFSRVIHQAEESKSLSATRPAAPPPSVPSGAPVT